MMSDVEHGLFDMVVVKGIFCFARNIVDLLQNIRKLKSLGIETQFFTANMTSIGNSEFALTIFGALAQEESANTSKRVKVGKELTEQLKENIRIFGRAILECLEYFTNENIIAKEVAGNCTKEAAERKVEMLKKIMEG